ncbi:MAG: hypothetical protein LBB66_01250 [Desulfovibrio sp.]|jgi:hypothetical protein|nr:hypothetical protein [Desulfovibrio sp.]
MWAFITIVCIALLAWLIDKALKGTPFAGSGPCMANPRAFRRKETPKTTADDKI